MFYTLGSILNLIGLIVSFYGMCNDVRSYSKAIPSLILWIIIIASIFQLIGISVYGALGIGNYTTFQADYSIICSSVALGFNFICVLFYLIEIFKNDNSQVK